MRKPVSIIANNDTCNVSVAISDTDLYAYDTLCRHHVAAGTVYFIDADNDPICADCLLHEIATC